MAVLGGFGIILSARFFMLGKQSGEMRPELGLLDGRLRACPDKPNCVSTTALPAPAAAERNHVDPIALPPGISRERGLAAAREVLASHPRTAITVEREGYLHAEARSRLFGFVDDVEIHVPLSANRVELRSASRVGYSDLGVNRARMDTFRAGLLERLK